MIEHIGLEVEELNNMEYIKCLNQAEQFLYKITIAKTPLATPENRRFLVENLGLFFGYIGKSLVIEKLSKNPIDAKSKDILKTIIKNWCSYLQNFPEEDLLQSLKKKILEEYEQSFVFQLFLYDASDLSYFLDNRDYIELINYGISYINESIGNQLKSELNALDDKLLMILTPKVIKGMLAKLPKPVSIEILNKKHLPENFWWRRWKETY